MLNLRQSTDNNDSLPLMVNVFAIDLPKQLASSGKILATNMLVCHAANLPEVLCANLFAASLGNIATTLWQLFPGSLFL